MTNEAFLEQFETCTLAKEAFNHRNHLRLAWLYLSDWPFEDARLKITQGLKRYATQLGAEQIYNETLTCFWIAQVYRALNSKLHTFDDFINQQEALLNKSLVFEYYSKARLESEEARQAWLEPDLKSLPPTVELS